MIPLARREMLQAARWYDRQGKGLGDRLLDEVRVGLLAILEFPGGHPPHMNGYRRWLLESFPYGLVYRIEADEIVVVAVANLKKRPSYWKRRPTAP